jgi:hypothetical protein
MSSTNDSKPSRSEILLAFFESEIYPSIQQSVAGITNGLVARLITHEAEKVIRKEAAAYALGKAPEIQAKLDQWFKDHLDGAIEKVGQETLQKVTAEMQARVLGRKS